jgi:phosphatidate phosphatase LPIN
MSNKPHPSVIQSLINDGIIKQGKNDVTYENIYQTKGKTKSRTCRGRIFLWDHSDLLVVSDIDGTITKSDVVGLVDSIGMDGGFGHTHAGVCEFYTHLKNRDLRFVYLTSRPISLMGYTRKFINNLRQGEESLPDGLMLCHTGSVRDVLITELVKKNPNEFKADVLRRQIVIPFAAAGRDVENKLFIAGFGNKLTDMKVSASRWRGVCWLTWIL